MHEHFAFRFTKQPAQIAGIRRQSFLLKTFREVSFCNASSFPREFFKCIFSPLTKTNLLYFTAIQAWNETVSHGQKDLKARERNGVEGWSKNEIREIKIRKWRGQKKCQERWRKKEAKLHLLSSLRLARSSSGPLTLFSSSAASSLCFSANFLTALWRFPRTTEGRVENRKKKLGKVAHP